MDMTSKNSNSLSRISLASKLLEAQAAFARKMRKKRIVLFESLISSLPRPLNILDVGGTQGFWELMGLISDDVKIVIYNVSHMEVSYSSLVSMVGDAREMREFKDKEFQIVFSNSVIEHVGT